MCLAQLLRVQCSLLLVRGLGRETNEVLKDYQRQSYSGQMVALSTLPRNFMPTTESQDRDIVEHSIV